MLSAADLARTYDTPGYADPAEVLDDYQRVLEYTAEHPAHGRVRVGNALDLPPGRVRGWMNDRIPDAVRGVQFAEKRGWIDTQPDEEIGQALCILLMGIFACGSITDHYEPLWAVSKPESDSLLWQSLRRLGLETRRNHVEDERPTELVPSEGATILGRALLALGAPMGDKTAESVPPLPDFILEAGEKTRRQCAEVLLHERGTAFEDKDTLQIQSRNRSREYKDSIAKLFRSLTDANISVGTNVVVSAEAARDLSTSSI